VRLLVDTQVALWFFADPSRLSGEAREAMEGRRNAVYLSAASVWEWALKRVRGKVTMQVEMTKAARRAGFLELPVTWPHAESADLLPRLHGDPFDRMLVAQALTEDLVLLTRDPLVRQYDVATMPA
jgi:PIN domain nuclease of toxin-antitoxin system